MSDEPIDLDALEAIAKAVQADEMTDHQVFAWQFTLAQPFRDYVLKFNPPTVLALIAAARELAVVKAERDLRLPEAKNANDVITELSDLLSAFRTERDALRKALEGTEKYVPVYETWMDNHDDATTLSLYRCGPTFGHLREVRAAIRKALT